MPLPANAGDPRQGVYPPEGRLVDHSLFPRIRPTPPKLLDFERVVTLVWRSTYPSKIARIPGLGRSTLRAQWLTATRSQTPSTRPRSLPGRWDISAPGGHSC